MAEGQKMSTDKLEVLHKTLAEILREPASPPTYFDEELEAEAQTGERVTKAPDNVRRVTEIPMEHFGKAPPRELGISLKEIHEAHVVRGARNEIPDIARQSLAEQFPGSAPADAGNQLASRLSHEVPGPRADPQTKSINAFRPAVSDNRVSPGGWALRGIAGILLAGGIGVGLATWLGSSGDVAKTAASQPAPLVIQTAPTAAALPPELTPLLQSMSRDLASMGKEIEQVKAGGELVARDNAKLSEQFRASQEQLTRAVAQLSELKASQEQAVRDNASVAGQIKGIQEQLTSIISRASEQNAPPRIAATPPRPPPSPRPAAPAVRQPVPTLSSPQATAQPRAEKPKPSPTSRPPAPAR
ncbi:hypothetical protein [Bradyrhizobium sp. JYMT SZCCT0428]|uniref:hypothetical protein n=1 Tax=Bradyrhizobium sp. JYMT SZCCT0428 TaxID=2807673 RepID=UPI001BACD9F4|nr:hypothetical protein [Bradyrhizobium sp. JYMT SZCCT0428]MBR1156897.1 hypothetical protein [Bradyrhizobium sp. JYMT SZCCT0428]